MRSVQQLLEAKAPEVFAIGPDDPVVDAIRLMADKRIGALLVMQGGKLVGIVSERDYARKVVLKGRNSQTTPVRDIMTSPVKTVRDHATVAEVAGVLVDAEQSQAGDGRWDGRGAGGQLAGEQGGGGAHPFHQAAPGGDGVVGDGVVVVERDRHPADEGVERPDASGVGGVDDDELADLVQVDLLGFEQVEDVAVEAKEGALRSADAALHGGLGAGEEELGQRDAGQRVEVRLLVGDDESHRCFECSCGGRGPPLRSVMGLSEALELRGRSARPARWEC